MHLEFSSSFSSSINVFFDQELKIVNIQETALLFIEASPILYYQVSVVFINTMGFVRVWVSCAWVWFCEGLLCQVLAKKGEKGFVAQMFRQESVLTNVVQTCRIKCFIMFLFGYFFVTCDLSYEHSCDLCSELPGVVEVLVFSFLLCSSRSN